MNYCSNCGTEVDESMTYCSECGVELESGVQPSEPATVDDYDDRRREPGYQDPMDTETSSGGDTTRDSMFYIGAVIAVIGVLTFPFFFWLIAIPESIAGYRGTTTMKYLPQDAQGNPAVKGSFLIFRWFGNLLVLMFVLGMVGGLLLIAL